MTHKAPGKFHRKGIGVVQLLDMFPDEPTASDWFENIRWPTGIRTCPRCTSSNTRPVLSRKPMPFWCSDCRKYFSVKIGTIMEASNLPLRKWVIALYLLSTNLKGVSSMKLHRDLGITQKTAWMMIHKIRECWQDNGQPLSGEVEVDETYIGGKETNKHLSKRLNAGRGAVGKTPVVGAKQRQGRIKAQPVRNADKATLQGFVTKSVTPGTTVYTDDHAAYRNLPLPHKAVKHSLGKYVDGPAHTNSIESFWSMLKRGIMGTYHHVSAKHLRRYVTEFAGRANVREFDTLVQMAALARGMTDKRMRYQDLTA